MNIFLSYRRGDLEALETSKIIFDYLKLNLGEKSIFRDLETVPSGIDFRTVISRELSLSDIMIIVIGNDWLASFSQSEAQQSDFVRFEIETALEKKIQLFPLLLGMSVTMPTENKLPVTISKLAFFNAFRFDLKKLSESLDNLLNELRILYSRFEVKADLMGKHITVPKWFYLENGKFRLPRENEKKYKDELEKKIESNTANAEEIFAWAGYIRDICMHITEWGAALSYYEKSARLGYIPAMYVLAIELEKGYYDPSLGEQDGKAMINETIDYKQSSFWFKKAAEALFEQKRNF